MSRNIAVNLYRLGISIAVVNHSLDLSAQLLVSDQWLVVSEEKMGKHRRCERCIANVA